MENLLKAGFVDTFNELNPNQTEAYTYRVRGKIYDRRVDYFFVSNALKSNIKMASIIEDDLGTAHRPVTLELNF